MTLPPTGPNSESSSRGPSITSRIDVVLPSKTATRFSKDSERVSPERRHSANVQLKLGHTRPQFRWPSVCQRVQRYAAESQEVEQKKQEIRKKIFDIAVSKALLDKSEAPQYNKAKESQLSAQYYELHDRAQEIFVAGNIINCGEDRWLLDLSSGSPDGYFRSRLDYGRKRRLSTDPVAKALRRQKRVKVFAPPEPADAVDSDTGHPILPPVNRAYRDAHDCFAILRLDVIDYIQAGLEGQDLSPHGIQSLVKRLASPGTHAVPQPTSYRSPKRLRSQSPGGTPSKRSRPAFTTDQDRSISLLDDNNDVRQPSKDRTAGPSLGDSATNPIYCD